MKTILTTGQVAGICQVAPRTVNKWVDSGGLRGYRLPNSKDRRVPRDELLRFLKTHGMPVDRLDAASDRVLVVGADDDLLGTIRSALAGLQVDPAPSAFCAGRYAERVRPGLVVVDCALGRIEASQIAHSLFDEPLAARGLVVAVLDEHSNGVAIHPGFTAAFRKPLDADSFARWVARHLPYDRELIDGTGHVTERRCMT